MLSDFSHKEEREDLNAVLANTAVKLLLSVFQKTYASLTSMAEVLPRSHLITAKTYPRIYRLYRKAAKRLEVKNIPLLCLDERYDLTAETIGTDGDCVIVLGSECVERFDDGQLLAVLGEQLGHVKCGHIQYLNLSTHVEDIARQLPQIADLAADTVKFLLITWRMHALETGDRAAAIAAGSLEPVEQYLWARMGGKPKHISVDMENSLMGIENLPEASEMNTIEKAVYQSLMDGFMTPYGMKRIQHLEEWCISGGGREKFPYLFYGHRRYFGLQDYHDGNALFQQGMVLADSNPQRCLALIHAAAQEEHSRALAFLGRSYLFGDNMLPCLPEPGADYLLQAAYKGNDDAQWVLGELLCEGVEGVFGQDRNAGRMLLVSAYAMGNAGAEDYLQKNFPKEPIVPEEVLLEKLDEFESEIKEISFSRKSLPEEQETLSHYLWIPKTSKVIAYEWFKEKTSAVAVSCSGIFVNTGFGLPKKISWTQLVSKDEELKFLEQDFEITILFGKKQLAHMTYSSFEKSIWSYIFTLKISIYKGGSGQ